MGDKQGKEIRASMLYRASSRTAMRATQRYPVGARVWGHEKVRLSVGKYKANVGNCDLLDLDSSSQGDTNTEFFLHHETWNRVRSYRLFKDLAIC